MATCEDCIHYDVCINHDECKDFKDHSRFVELPCKVGDKIFSAAMGKIIYQGIVGRIELDDEGIAIITTDGYCFDSSICYHTQEEAEQALKGREDNV